LQEIAQRWHGLAEQRLAYYTELYRSGRWKHYYTQEAFAARMLDVIAAAKKWRKLAGHPEAPLPLEAAQRDFIRPAA
ncbi:MAG: TIGR03809 family protein, partial [Pseudolabrys sp.]|nr:TIGR03809 family protein [Pseudolabrys sp.]